MVPQSWSCETVPASWRGFFVLGHGSMKSRRHYRGSGLGLAMGSSLEERPRHEPVCQALPETSLSIRSYGYLTNSSYTIRFAPAALNKGRCSNPVRGPASRLDCSPLEQGIKMRYATFCAGSFLIMGGVLIIGTQVALWLRDGFWTPCSLWIYWQAIGGTSPDWPSFRGGQLIAAWLLHWPLSVSALSLGLILRMGAGRIWAHFL